jgi:hypothetical protein
MNGLADGSGQRRDRCTPDRAGGHEQDEEEEGKDFLEKGGGFIFLLFPVNQASLILVC